MILILRYSCDYIKIFKEDNMLELSEDIKTLYEKKKDLPNAPDYINTIRELIKLGM